MTITAKDYTVQFDISKEQYVTFKHDFYDPSNPISKIGQLKLYVKYQFESMLSKVYEEVTEEQMIDDFVEYGDTTESNQS